MVPVVPIVTGIISAFELSPPPPPPPPPSSTSTK